jgi:lysophospholipase L1-like esterase
LAAFLRALHAIHFSKPAVVLRQGLLIALITFALGEVLLRIYDRFHPLPIFYSEFDNRWRGKPFEREYGEFPLNSHGFKDVEFEKQKAPGTYRILGIGDSFAYGVVPYPANYLTLLEERLNAAGRSVEVINMGVPNAGTSDYLAIFVKEGLELNPDMVSVSFFIGNDFVVRRVKRKLYSYSYLATYIKYAHDVRTKVADQFNPAGGSYDDSVGPFTDNAFLEVEHMRSPQFLRENTEFERDFFDAFEPLLRMKEICDRRGIHFTVAIIPDEMQIDSTLQNKVMGAYHLRPEAYDFTLPNKRLQAALKAHHIDYIDLLDGFAAGSARARLYRPNDTHWNIAGNALAAELLSRHLLPLIPSDGGSPSPQR